MKHLSARIGRMSRANATFFGPVADLEPVTSSPAVDGEVARPAPNVKAKPRRSPRGILDVLSGRRLLWPSRIMLRCLSRNARLAGSSRQRLASSRGSIFRCQAKRDCGTRKSRDQGGTRHPHAEHIHFTPRHLLSPRGSLERPACTRGEWAFLGNFDDPGPRHRWTEIE